jgi:hypothetical protein
VAVSVLAARGVNGILGARFATGLCRESNLTSPTTNTSTNKPQSSRPHRNAPLSCKAEGIADTRTELIGHLDGRSPNMLKHNMITAHFVMDNDDYPSNPRSNWEGGGVAEWPLSARQFRGIDIAVRGSVT